MTGQENRALSERLALLADDAGMPGELVWEKHDQCDRLHAPFYYIKDDAVSTTGRYCGTCYQEYGNADGYRVPETDAEIEAVRSVFREHPDGFVQRRAKDLTNPTHLLPLVQTWQDTSSSHVLLVEPAFYRAKSDGLWDGELKVSYLLHEEEYPGTGQSWGEALASAFAAVIEAQKGA